jgi:VanZ family protein
MAENITAAKNSLAMKVVKYWLPVFVMIGAMYYFSTDMLSGQNTRSLIDKFFDLLGYDLSRSRLDRANYLARKAAHFIEYALLAGLLFRAMRADSSLRWRFRWAAYSLAVCVAWALADELHQSFTNSRTGSVRDAILDSSGALFMLVVIALFNRKAQPSQPSQPSMP